MKKKTVTITILLLSFVFSCKNKTQDNQTYVYDMNVLKNFPRDMIHYEKIGEKPIPIAEPAGIALDTNNNNDHIYICGLNTIQIYNKDFQKISDIKIDGKPTAITVDIDRVFVAVRSHIEVYDKNGHQTNTWADLGKDAIITSLSVNDKYVYLADAVSRSVYKFSKNGRLLSIIDGQDKKKKAQGFIVPSPFFDIVCENSSVWIVNPGKQTLEQYAGNDRILTYWQKRSTDIAGFNGCCNPVHITLIKNSNNGSKNSIVTSEKGLIRIKTYDLTGNLQSVVATEENFSLNSSIIDIAADSKGRIYALDISNSIVKIFSKKRL